MPGYIPPIIAIIVMLIIIGCLSALARHAATKFLKSEKYAIDKRMKEIALIWVNKQLKALNEEQRTEIKKHVEKEFPGAKI
jgi:hypothetical protein